YLKNSNGDLYISVRKVLYGLTESVSLATVDQFLVDYEDVDLEGKLPLFIDLLEKNGKKVSSNRLAIQRLIALLSLERFETIEDFVPVAIVLSIVDNSDVLRLDYLELSRHHATLHDIALATGISHDDPFYKRLKRMKGNTSQEGVIANMFAGIEASRSQPFERVLFGLGIRNVGENTAKLLANHFRNIESLIAASAEELMQVNGVGETLVWSIQDFFTQSENLEIIERLRGHGLQLQSTAQTF